ncbi:MAG: nucleotidyltransferase family protein [Acidiferrobacterales bacterium]|nr:nucleotidyltransferase family protein [Acidiferrobacterales bacterium]
MVALKVKLNDVAVIVLAAGASSRFGSVKQIADLDGKPFIEHILVKLQSAGFTRLHVVTGANHSVITPVLPQAVSVVFNENWESGMAGSIGCGVKSAIAQANDICGVLIVLSDQPGISAKHYRLLGESLFKGKNIRAAATAYGDSAGVPAAFSRSLFPQLIDLQGERGAQQLIRQLGNKVKILPTDSRLDDIDTLDDYKQFLDRK